MAQAAGIMGEDRFCGDLICLLRRHLPQRGSRGGDLFRRSAPPSPEGEGREGDLFWPSATFP